MELQLPVSVRERENKGRGRVETSGEGVKENRILQWSFLDGIGGKAGINETLLLGGASWVDLNLKSFLLFVPPLADLNEKQRTQRTRQKMRREVYREQERRQ